MQITQADSILRSTPVMQYVAADIPIEPRFRCSWWWQGYVVLNVLQGYVVINVLQGYVVLDDGRVMFWIFCRVMLLLMFCRIMLFLMMAGLCCSECFAGLCCFVDDGRVMFLLMMAGLCCSECFTGLCCCCWWQGYVDGRVRRDRLFVLMLLCLTSILADTSWGQLSQFRPFSRDVSTKPQPTACRCVLPTYSQVCALCAY